jgi:hypothetical protein
VCLSQHRASRFVVAFSAARSEEAAARVVVPLTRERTAGRRGIRWISDGLRAYIELVRKTYRDPVRSGGRGRPRKLPTPGVGLTQLVKHRSGYRVVKVEVRHCFGPEPRDRRTVRIERLNGVVRDRLNCVTRKTHAFAKQTRTWDAAVGLCIFAHNWITPHPALREQATDLPRGQRYRKRTPAVAVGLTDHVWTWEEFLSRRALVTA